MLVFFCSSVPVVLFDTPGISRCRSQHVSVKSLSLFHHSISVIYLFPVMIQTFTQTEQLYVLSHDRSQGRGWVPVKPGLDPPHHSYFNTDRSKAVLLLWLLTVICSCCPYLYFGSAIMLVTYFVNFR